MIGSCDDVQKPRKVALMCFNAPVTDITYSDHASRYGKVQSCWLLCIPLYVSYTHVFPVYIKVCIVCAPPPNRPQHVSLCSLSVADGVPRRRMTKVVLHFSLTTAW